MCTRATYNKYLHRLQLTIQNNDTYNREFESSTKKYRYLHVNLCTFVQTLSKDVQLNTRDNINMIEI